jgi:hypothetical protein
MNSNEHRGVTCAAKSATLPLPTHPFRQVSGTGPTLQIGHSLVSQSNGPGKGCSGGGLLTRRPHLTRTARAPLPTPPPQAREGGRERRARNSGGPDLARPPSTRNCGGRDLARPPRRCFACRREERGDQFPADLLVPKGLRYCCRNTITHPGPDVSPLTVVALPHRFCPFLVKSPAGSWAFCTPFTGTKAT